MLIDRFSSLVILAMESAKAFDPMEKPFPVGVFLWCIGIERQCETSQVIVQNLLT